MNKKILILLCFSLCLFTGCNKAKTEKVDLVVTEDLREYVEENAKPNPVIEEKEIKDYNAIYKNYFKSENIYPEKCMINLEIVNKDKIYYIHTLEFNDVNYLYIEDVNNKESIEIFNSIDRTYFNVDLKNNTDMFYITEEYEIPYVKEICDNIKNKNITSIKYQESIEMDNINYDILEAKDNENIYSYSINEKTKQVYEMNYLKEDTRILAEFIDVDDLEISEDILASREVSLQEILYINDYINTILKEIK